MGEERDEIPDNGEISSGHNALLFEQTISSI